MTVTNVGTFASYVGDNLTVAFAVEDGGGNGFKFFDQDDLIVTLDGVVQTLNVDYTVTGEGTDTGVVTFTSIPGNGVAIIIQRDTDELQNAAYTASGPFPAQSVESNFDRTIMLHQENDDKLDRAILMPIGSTGGTIPQNNADAAGKVILFDDSGNPEAVQDFQWFGNLTDPPSDAVGNDGDAGTVGFGLTNVGQYYVKVNGTWQDQGYSISGPPGVQGDVFRWTGAWSGATAYLADDAVNDDGTSYICIADHTNEQPGVSLNWTTYWDVLALKGAGAEEYLNALDNGVDIGVQTPAQRQTAIDALFVAAESAGKKVFFPRGTYIIAGQVNPVSGNVIFGNNPQFILDDTADLNQNVFNLDGVENVHIYGIECHGNVQRLATITGQDTLAGQVFTAGQKVTINITATGVTSGSTRIMATSDQLPTGVVLQTAAATNIIAVTVVNTLTSDVTVPALTIDVSEYGYTPTGSNVGNCFGISSSSNILIEKCKSYHAVKHCLDISASEYSVTPDDVTIGGYPAEPSNHVVVRDCEFWGGGDDNVTTHGSEHILFDSIYSHSSNGSYVPTNTNAFEIDDSSRYVTLQNVHGSNCTNGLEVKGHLTDPAANHVYVVNSRFDYCDVGVDLHHTGHGQSTEPQSPTAGKIYFVNCTIRNCLTQYFRSLSYKDLVIQGLMMSDDGNCENAKPFAIENGAENVTVDGVKSEGFDSKIETGLFIQDQATGFVSVTNCDLVGGHKYGVLVGSTVNNVHLENIKVTAPPIDVTPLDAQAPGVYLTSSAATYDLTIQNIVQLGYPEDMYHNGVYVSMRDFMGRTLALDANLYVGEATRNLYDETDSTVEGFTYEDGLHGMFARNGGLPFAIRRGGTTGQIANFRSNQTEVGSISVTGSATAYNTSSDPRLKTAFAPIDGAAALQMVIDAVENDYIGEFEFLNDPGTKVWGYNAHALIDNQPGFGGSEGEGGRELAVGEIYEEASVDADGKAIPAKRVEAAGVDQGKRVVVLEMALYHLLEKIETLEAEVEALTP